MTNWLSDDDLVDEDVFVSTENELTGSESYTYRDKRRQLEMLLDEKKLQDDLDDYY